MDQRVDVLQVNVDWKAGFVTWLERRGKAANTILAYGRDVEAFIRWFEMENHQAFEVGLMTTFDLQGYRRAEMAGGVAPSTWNRRRASLQVFCGWALGEGLLAYDPMRDVQAMEEVELAPRWLDGQQYGRFMRQVERLVQGAGTVAARRQAMRDQAMVALMALAGLREGEVSALNCGDVEMGERSGRVTVRAGKGGKRRQVPLSVEARRWISAWVQVRAGQAGEALFVGKGGERVMARCIQRRVGEIGRLAGVDVTPHVLRHTFAKRALDAGAQITVVSKLLGHSRIDTTARYVMAGWDDLTAAVDGM